VTLKRRILIKGIAAMPFIGGLTAASAAGGVFRPAEYLTDEARSQLQNLTGTLPKGKLGKFELSRIIIGCNPIGGYSHARDLRYVGTLSKRWHTPQKTKETWAVAEAAGINAAALIASQYPVFNEYKKETGSKMINICQCSIGQPADRLAPLREAVDLGADIIYIQGQNADNLYRTNALEVLFQAMEYTHSQGLPFGVGAHSIQTILKSIDLGIKPDFYFKTFHHDNYWSASPRESRKELEPLPPSEVAPVQAPATGQATPATSRQQNPQPGPITAGSPDAPRVDHDAVNDNIWDLFPEQTIEIFRKIDVPMVGFKTMAAGAITPADGFRWAFGNGADFICAGIYDFQMVDDINAAIDVLGSIGERQRPWYS